METTRSKTPGTLKEVLSRNVRHQQARKEKTASPPEARRPARERIKERKLRSPRD